MEPKEVTVMDVIRICIETLNGISIRMDEIDRIGRPLANVLHNLIECVNAMERSNAEQEKEHENVVKEEEVDAEN